MPMRIIRLSPAGEPPIDARVLPGRTGRHRPASSRGRSMARGVSKDSTATAASRRPRRAAVHCANAGQCAASHSPSGAGFSAGVPTGRRELSGPQIQRSSISPCRSSSGASSRRVVQISMKRAAAASSQHDQTFSGSPVSASRGRIVPSSPMTSSSWLCVRFLPSVRTAEWASERPNVALAHWADPSRACKRIVPSSHAPARSARCSCAPLRFAPPAPPR